MHSMDEWIKEAKNSRDADKIGMYLFHNGVVRADARSRVREADESAAAVKGMKVSYDEGRLQAALESAGRLAGVYYVRAVINEGELAVGDDIMLALVGGDTREHTIDALTYLVTEIKTKIIEEKEIY